MGGIVYQGDLYEAAEHLMNEVCCGVDELASTITSLSKPEDLEVDLGEIAAELRSVRHIMAEGLQKVTATSQALMKTDETFNALYMGSKYGRNMSLNENPQEGITYTESNFYNDGKYYNKYYEEAMEKMLLSDKYTDEQKEKIREAKEQFHKNYEDFSKLITLREQKTLVYMLENHKDFADKYIKENFGDDIEALRGSQGSQYMSPEQIIKNRELIKIKESIDATQKEFGIEEENWWEKMKNSVATAWTDIKNAVSQTGAAWGKAVKSGNFSDYVDALKQTGSTVFVTAESAISGVAKIVELANDGLVFIGGGAVALATWAFTDKRKANNLMNGILDYVREDMVGNIRKSFYEHTSIGQTINENSNLKYDSAGSKGIINFTESTALTAAAIATEVVTGGAATPLIIGLAGLYGGGKGVEKYTQNVNRKFGEDYNYKEAFLQFGAGALSEAASVAIKGKIGGNIFKVVKNPTMAKEIFTMLKDTGIKDILKNEVKSTSFAIDTGTIAMEKGTEAYKQYKETGKVNWEKLLLEGIGELAIARITDKFASNSIDEALHPTSLADTASNFSKKVKTTWTNIKEKTKTGKDKVNNIFDDIFGTKNYANKVDDASDFIPKTKYKVDIDGTTQNVTKIDAENVGFEKTKTEIDIDEVSTPKATKIDTESSKFKKYNDYNAFKEAYADYTKDWFDNLSDHEKSLFYNYISEGIFYEGNYKAVNSIKRGNFVNYDNGTINVRGSFGGIDTYTFDDFERMYDQSIDEFIIKQSNAADELNMAIHKAGLKEDTILYRGTNWDSLEKYGINKGDDPNLILEKLQGNGGTYVDEGFMSATPVPDSPITAEKPIILEMNCEKGTPAADLSTINDMEQEVLLGLGQVFSIDGVSDNGGQIIIHMTHQ